MLKKALFSFFLITMLISCKNEKQKELTIPNSFENKIDFLGFINNVKLKMKDFKTSSSNCQEINYIFPMWVNQFIKLETPFMIDISLRNQECSSLAYGNKFEFEDIQLIQPNKARDSIISEKLLIQNDTLTLYEIHYKVKAKIDGQIYDRVWFISDEDKDNNLNFVANFLYNSTARQ